MFGGTWCPNLSFFCNYQRFLTASLLKTLPQQGRHAPFPALTTVFNGFSLVTFILCVNILHIDDANENAYYLTFSSKVFTHVRITYCIN